MINSLRKDSHITHLKRYENSHYSESGVLKNGNKTLASDRNVNSNVIIKKPAEISFCGFSDVIDLAIKKGPLNDILEKSYSNKIAKTATQKIFTEAVDFLEGSVNKIEDGVKSFIDSNKEGLTEIINDAKAMVTKANEKKPLEEASFKKAVKETIKESIDIFHTVKKPNGIYTKKWFKDFLGFAANSQAVFSAVYAAGLACFIRPATIVAIPSKKNKDDNKYAAAHSIASGAIGYIVSMVINAPIATAAAKIKKNPEKYIKTNFEYLGKTAKDGSIAGKGAEVATKYINMLPEVAFAIPKAIITISIIPPILKYVFGLERKRKGKNEPIVQDYSLINFKSVNFKQKKAFQSFMGGNN